ncbi:MAG TPA: hypothetical protein VG455_04005, partial [Acidimicrobiales bacterium]|nr:hypothetical protein [Acidimicrobiales bacterium]
MPAPPRRARALVPVALAALLAGGAATGSGPASAQPESPPTTQNLLGDLLNKLLPTTPGPN